MPLAPDLAIGGITSRDAVKGFQYLVAGTTLWSGASYALNKNAVTILGTDQDMKKKQGFRGRAVIGLTYASAVALAVYLAQKDAKGVDTVEAG